MDKIVLELSTVTLAEIKDSSEPRAVCRITAMGEAGRYKRVRHRRAERPTKEPGDEKVFGGITPEEFCSEKSNEQLQHPVLPRNGFMP